MTDITREAVEREAQALLKLCGENSSTAMLLALRTALDEAQRQRDTQRTDAYDARQDDLRELAEWRAMFARLAAQGLPGATPLMPNNWSQDVAFVAFALHGRRDRVAELEAAVRALEGATAPLTAERDAAIARAEAAESELAKLHGPTTGYYMACFKGRSRGYVCWWGPNNHGYTNDLGAAGVYEHPVPRYHDSGDDNVPVPVAFAHKLAARRMVDIGDTGNECMWSAAALRAALEKEDKNG